MKPENIQKNTGRIIFFDGYCTLCNRSVDWLTKRDKTKRFRFASLQGNHAKKLIPQKYTQHITSIVYLDEQTQSIYTQSTAILKIIEDLGGLYKILLLAKLLPRCFLDFLYQNLASKRYQFFGKRSTCRVPSKDDQSILLD